VITNLRPQCPEQQGHAGIRGCGFHDGASGVSTIVSIGGDGEHGSMRGTTATGLWSRTDLRARWRSFALLGVLAGLTAGLATAAFDGASRTETALSRLEERNNASDAVVFASQNAIVAPSWEALAQRPEVEKIARWTLVFGQTNGTDDVLFVPSDGVFLNEVDRPIVVAGRMFDPKSPTEMVVTDDLNSLGHAVGVGDLVHFDAYATTDETGPPGASVDFTVVGVIHSSMSFEFTGGEYISPAFLEVYGAQIETAENAMVKLRNGPADVAALRRDASTDVIAGVPVLDLHATARRVTATTDVERTMLLLMAAIIALAGLTFVGQAVARSANTVGADASTLRAMGMTRRQLTIAALIPHLLTAFVATAIAVSTAAIASRWFPVGLAARVDPDRGIRVAPGSLALAVLATITLIVLIAAVAGWLATGSDARARSYRPSWFAQRGLVSPLTVGIGVRLALESGRGGRGSSRSALVGAVAAVAGIVAIVTLNHGLTESLSHPEVAGVAWDASVVPNKDAISGTSGVDTAVVDAVAAQPGIAEIGTIGRVVTNIGEVGVPTFTAIDHGSSPPVQLVSLEGRVPRNDSEIVLGPSTARDLGVRIGATVELGDGAPATVVGLGLFPSDVHAQFDEGALVYNDRWFALANPGGEPNDGIDFLVAVRFADRRDVEAQVAALGESLGNTAQYVVPPERPQELSNLHNVQRLPMVLSIVLAALGVAAVGHALYSSVRRRNKDFAIMRALGITRRGTRVILAAQGTTVAIVGLLFGVPLGLLAGRAGWQAITDRVPLTFRSPVTVAAIGFVVPAAIIVANALAVLPGRRAARVDPAVVLRSE
jgi:ABC-type lipoprotein release transport system permease subunit